jgi:hypothetical protein
MLYTDYIPNSVWMAKNIILIAHTPSRHPFGPTGMPDSVRTIQNKFWMVKSLNWVLDTDYIPNIVQIDQNITLIGHTPSRHLFGPTGNARWCPNHSE